MLQKRFLSIISRKFSTSRAKGLLSESELSKLIESKKIHTVTMAFPDHYGRLMGKRFEADFFMRNALKEGGHACNYLLACDLNMDIPKEIEKWDTGYGDFHMVPDLSSLRYMWINGHAIVMTDVFDQDGSTVHISPRTMLNKQVQESKLMGFNINCASELEYYPFEKTAKQNFQEKYRGLKLDSMYPEDYNLLMNDRNEPYVEAVRKMLSNCGIIVETSKGEAGSSQHEINVQYSDPINMADNHVFYKQILKYVAHLHGKSVTFMAKPFENEPGSGMHIHFSMLGKDGKNAFVGNDFILDKKTNLTCSSTMAYFLGGWMKYAIDFFPFYAPYVNSYKRFITSSWAPTNLNAWSVDNRTSPFRIVGRDESLRVEFRIPGADANPYLAFSAALASGLTGIREKINPPPIFEGNVYDVDSSKIVAAPKNLENSAKIFGNSEIVERTLGKSVQKHYHSLFNMEANFYNRVITDWEIQRYFDRA